MGLCASKTVISDNTYAPVTVTAAETKIYQLSKDVPVVQPKVQQQPSREWTAEADSDWQEWDTPEPSDDDEGTKSRWAEETTEFSSRISTFIADTWGDIRQYYRLDKKKLGEGGFGYVVQGKSYETGLRCAIKKLSKARAKDTRTVAKNEMDIMKMTDHPNIVKLFETFEDKKHMHLVLELCAGGDLYQHLKSRGQPYTEHQAGLIMEQVLRPVFYLHEHKDICHRDIKLENFLWLSQAPVEENTLKLADFGLSCSYEPGKVLQMKVGTMKYASPQVLDGNYDQSADVWSCGVIMYILLSFDAPFPGKNDAEVAQRVKKGNYAFKDAAWANVSDDARDLIRKLLKYQPFDRSTAAQALDHSWLRNHVPGISDAAPVSPASIRALRQFVQQSKFKRAALHSMAMQLGDADMRAHRKDFAALDLRGIGVLTVEQLQEKSQHPDMAAIEPQLRQIIRILTEGGRGEDEIGFTDFLAANFSHQFFQQDAAEGLCRGAFRGFDKDSDGYIRVDELEMVVGGTISRNSRRAEVLAAMLAEADFNRDGKIDYEEFRLFLLGHPERAESRRIV